MSTDLFLAQLAELIV